MKPNNILPFAGSFTPTQERTDYRLAYLSKDETLRIYVCRVNNDNAEISAHDVASNISASKTFALPEEGEHLRWETLQELTSRIETYLPANQLAAVARTIDEQLQYWAAPVAAQRIATLDREL